MRGRGVTRLVAARATGLLAVFSEAGVLAPADVHVAQRLGALAGEDDDRVLLAVALTVRGTRNGSVVLDLADAASTIVPDTDEADDGPVELPWPALDDWVETCAASPLVTGSAGGPPLQMVGARLWLDRYWRQEVQIADDLLRRSLDRPDDIDPAAAPTTWTRCSPTTRRPISDSPSRWPRCRASPSSRAARVPGKPRPWHS